MNNLRVREMKHSRLTKFAYHIDFEYDRASSENNEIIPTIISWCSENMGPYTPEKRKWFVRLFRDSIRIYIHEEKDAFAFKMRWL